MENNARILIIEDDEKMLNLLTKVLEKERFAVTPCLNGKDGLKKLEENSFDIAITDLRMPRMSGMELLKAVKRVSPDTYVIIMTAFGSIDSAVESIKKGAYNYIAKPFKMDEMLMVVKRALEEKKLRKEVASLRREVGRKYQFSNIIGKSKVMQEVFDLIKRVSDSRSTVLIYGKSGTGKELVAKAIHYNSPRKNFPFVAINCSAIPDTLLESELFGHTKGAFTGAISSKKGLFEEAEGGTLFLDEIGDVSLSTQVKLLRVLQEREIKRLGMTESTKIDIRLITATNQILQEKVIKGEFREDLLYRLNVVPIVLPELKDRIEDIPLLVEHFLKKYSNQEKGIPKGITNKTMSLLLDYEWPGNVRELENVIEGAIALGRNEEILPEDLYPHFAKTKINLQQNEAAEGMSLAKIELKHITKILRATNGNRLEAAAILGIDRRTLYRKIKDNKLDLLINDLI